MAMLLPLNRSRCTEIVITSALIDLTSTPLACARCRSNRRYCDAAGADLIHDVGYHQNTPAGQRLSVEFRRDKRHTIEATIIAMLISPQESPTTLRC